MQPSIDEVEKRLSPKPGPDFEPWLDGRARDATQKVRTLIREIAETTFALIVGQTWFAEFKSLDENSMTVQSVECKADLREVQIKL
jgi:hypothetical protein